MGGDDFSFLVFRGQDKLLSSQNDAPLAVVERQRVVALLLDDITLILVQLGCNYTTRGLCGSYRYEGASRY